MTVSQIYNYMTQRVIPESVVPQNIGVALMDENASLPELDAFTFLNRLRSLGIGSADFLYLLKGCGAPEEAVARIEQNPAMNLQSLIVTLEGSGLTPKDYTRMLYTARQLWERTLTMRLDAVNAQHEGSEEDTPDSYSEPLEERVPPEEALGQQEDDSDECEHTKEEPSETDEDDDAENAPEERRRPPISHERDIEFVSMPGRQRRRTESISESDDDDEDDDDTARSGWHKGGMIAAACGAVVLAGLAFAMDRAGFAPITEPKYELAYAQSSEQLFGEIYTAYNSGRIGGENIMRLCETDSVVFGDLLVKLPEELGVFSQEDTILVADTEKILVYKADSDTFSLSTQIVPPEGAEFLEIKQTESGICAVYVAEDICGITGYSLAGEQRFDVQQCGALTALAYNDTTVSVGSVYVPEFSQSFTVQQTEYYIPWTAKDGERSVISPESVLTDGSAVGCGYALYAEYDMETGELICTQAALGDPLYSGACGFSAVMGGENGERIIANDQEGGSVPIEGGRVIACAAGVSVYCTAEKAEDGSASITVRGSDHQPASVLTNIPAEIIGMRISSTEQGVSTLYVYGNDGVILCADISDSTAPAVLELSRADGIVRGEYALCGYQAAGGVRMSLFKLDGNSAVEAGSFSKTLSAQALDSLEFGSGNTFFIAGADRCGAAYTYFDGVSRISEYALFGKSRIVRSLFDDKSGFTAAADINGRLVALCGNTSIQMD